ncbi:hypothetical protein ONS95_000053 [Cadophora gregata]|uniref:uncharacterized protein n=1 Tax=Cadophora gregata TaxID=51156 RepID=UPI0026DB00CD|nr:uncharacterized protein ONS95_000053 [Cadophora gregata]KAK0115679.1 hypothetical protein ONS96_014125 [Cadophora gregata f. sp. sojae]KAK0128069.1 hypothetical protein ONS95_000053 [Cadophora gregata]
MSLLLNEPEDASDSNPYVHKAGPAILLPGEAIGNIVTRANNLISDHREWLANLPLQNVEAKRQLFTVPQVDATPISSLNGQIAGPSPLPSPEAIGIFPPANSLLTTISITTIPNGGVFTATQVIPPPVTASLPAGSAAASASIASLQAALNSANNALASARLSASLALATAAASLQAAVSNASIQSQAALVATQNAASAIASAQASANQAVAAAQSSADGRVLLANNALQAVQTSASAAVAGANALASGAQSTATNAIAQAQATISAVASQASAAIAASRISAMNRTTFILAITFAILGSSLITILLFYLIVRYRSKRRLQRQDELKSKIRRKRHESEESDGPSLSEFPLPMNRTQWSRVNSEERRSGRNRSTGRGDTGYWPRGNARVSATDRERLAYMRGAGDMAEIDYPPPLVTRKTWTVGPAPRERERAAKRERVNEPFMTSSGSSDVSLSRQTWSPSKDDLLQSQSATLVTTPGLPTGMSAPLSRDGPSSERPVGNMVRKNTLTYDPDHPDRPPKFTTWLEESFRSISPFPTMGAVQTARPEMSRAVLGRQSVRVGTGRPFGERGDSDGSAIIGAAM